MQDDKVESETRKPTTLSQYKQEVRFLRGQIKKAAATIRLREKVKGMRAILDNLNDNINRGFDPNTP